MKLTELTGLAAGPGPDPEIVGLSADSRTIRPGCLFAALPGTRQDGRAFAADAVARGAVAILTDDAEALGLTPASRERVAILVDPNPRRRFVKQCFVALAQHLKTSWFEVVRPHGDMDVLDESI